jgi:hypothetical protein
MAYSHVLARRVANCTRSIRKHILVNTLNAGSLHSSASGVEVQI